MHKTIGTNSERFEFPTSERKNQRIPARILGEENQLVHKQGKYIQIKFLDRMVRHLYQNCIKQ